MKTKAKDPTHAVFGVDLDGEPFATTISSGPHWIIAGQTGSGKSVFANALIISMLCHATPDELKLQWVDPKKVEATAYIGLPFCPNDPITDMQEAYGYVAYLAWLMDERYELLSKYSVKNISEFNEYVDAHPDCGEKKMSYFVLMVDEYADMVMQTPEVEKNIVRLGQKARACGIHVIVSTQRPSADILSPILKANIPSRVCLKTTDQTNSMIVLDEPGGESLRGYGDGLVKTVDGTITRVQGPWISNDEIDRIFAHLRGKYPRPEPIDYKSKVVELGICDWAETYTDDVPVEQRKVKAKKQRASYYG